MNQISTSPLEEASPSSIEELFSKDPLQLANSDIEKIVQVLRAERAQWVQSETKKASTGKKAVKEKKPVPKLNLEDLFPGMMKD